jgi:hypothetical protein
MINVGHKLALTAGGRTNEAGRQDANRCPAYASDERVGGDLHERLIGSAADVPERSAFIQDKGQARRWETGLAEYDPRATLPKP